MLKLRFNYVDLCFLGAAIGYLSVQDYWGAAITLVIGAACSAWLSNSRNS